ncbi:hypothetical protein PPHE_a0782 [Pseudoalteromonas phenolica O-BC30]|nr:hypothetical protein [Pseudoalteromonas phenolica O-BC30]
MSEVHSHQQIKVKTKPQYKKPWQIYQGFDISVTLSQV